MDILNRKSEEVTSFIDTLDKLLETIKSCLRDRTPSLNGEKFLTNRDVCKKLHLSERTLQDWRDTGKIAYIQISGKVLYKESDVRRLLEENYYSEF